MAAVDVLVARTQDRLNVARYSGYEVVGGARPVAGVDRLIVSWARREDFTAGGAYMDRYFCTSAHESARSLWLLIAASPGISELSDPNVRLIRRAPEAPRFDLGHLARSAIARVTDECELGASSNSKHNGKLSATQDFARFVAAVVMMELKRGRFRSVLLPYEAQPFQHAIFRATKSFDTRIQTIGYLHSVLPPVPTDLIYREGAPDRLLVHGAGQRLILCGRLGWPETAVETIPSLHYRGTSSAEFGGQVFLPYSFADESVVVKALEAYLAGAGRASLPVLTLRNHPMMGASKKHLRLMSRLDAVLSRYADRSSDNISPRRLSVFVGATAAVIEALERGVDVVHICGDPLLEAYHPDLWDALEMEPLGERCFRYRLREPGAYIVLGENQDTLERHCAPR